jgi:hypothetical protein
LTDKEISAGGPTCKLPEPVIVPDLAMMLVVPGLTLVATPALLTVEIAAADELHATELVRFCVLPSVYVPAAVNCCVLPKGMDADCGFTAMETRAAAGANPVPPRDAVCGLLLALSVTRRVPALAPIAFGANATLTVQLALAGSVLGLRGQFEVGMKSDTLAAMLVIAKPTV